MKPKIGPSSLDICHHNCYALLHIILEVFYHHTIFRQRRTLNPGGILIWFLCFSKNVNLLEYGHRIIIHFKKSSSFSLQGEQLCLIDLLLQSQLEVEAAALKMNLSQKCKCCSDGRVVSWLSRRSLLQRHASEGEELWKMSRPIAFAFKTDKSNCQKSVLLNTQTPSSTNSFVRSFVFFLSYAI